MISFILKRVDYVFAKSIVSSKIGRLRRFRFQSRTYIQQDTNFLIRINFDCNFVWRIFSASSLNMIITRIFLVCAFFRVFVRNIQKARTIRHLRGLGRAQNIKNIMQALFGFNFNQCSMYYRIMNEIKFGTLYLHVGVCLHLSCFQCQLFFQHGIQLVELVTSCSRLDIAGCEDEGSQQ